MRTFIRRIYDKLTLRDKISILNVMIILTTLLVLGYFSSDISSGIITEKTEKSAVRELELIDSNLFTLIRSIEDYSKVAASNNKVQELLGDLAAANKDGSGQDRGQIDVISMRPEMYSTLANIISPNTPIFAVSIFVNQQEVYSDEMIDSDSLKSVIGEDFLETALQKQVPVWSDLLRLRLSDGREENVFAVAKLVIDLNTGRNLGVVLLYINEKEISRIYAEHRSSADSKQYIMNEAGQIVSAENKEVLHRHILDILDIGRDKFAELERERKVMIDQQNRTYMLSLQQSDKMNWQIISRVTMDEYMKDRKIIERFIWIVGALCLVFAFISSYYISNTVTKPIQKLVKIMRQIKKGDMSVRMETVDNHEIDMLTRGFNSLMDRVQTLLEEIVVEQQAKQQFEFKLIQSQMNPHFLYNSLETILSLNKLGRHDEAMQVIRTLAEFYRLSLSRGSDVIRISDEVQIIRDYLEIQKVRYSQYMSYMLDFQNDIMDYSVPKLTLQPLVENAIYHGLKSRGNRGKLELQGYSENGRIVLVVGDDGAGIPAEKIAMLLGENRPQPGKAISFGLASVDRRIKLLYGYEYGLQIESEIGSYTKIIITLPAIKMEG